MHTLDRRFIFFSGFDLPSATFYSIKHFIALCIFRKKKKKLAIDRAKHGAAVQFQALVCGNFIIKPHPRVHLLSTDTVYHVFGFPRFDQTLPDLCWLSSERSVGSSRFVSPKHVKDRRKTFRFVSEASNARAHVVGHRFPSSENRVHSARTRYNIYIYIYGLHSCRRSSVDDSKSLSYVLASFIVNISTDVCTPLDYNTGIPENHRLMSR